MKFIDAMNRENVILWLVEWWPEDFEGGVESAKSYCTAPDMNAAFALYSTLTGDLVRVTRIGNGVYVPELPVPSVVEKATLATLRDEIAALLKADTDEQSLAD